MVTKRRDFLKTASAGAGWAMLGGCASTIEDCQQMIENRPVRRNIATLSATDPIIEAYRTAVRRMKELPESDPRNWNRQARIHNDFCPHGNWLFLPWHRCYLLYFERICRKLSGLEDFALPYWNWSQSPQIPAAFWGGSLDPLFDATRWATPNDIADASSVGPLVLESILTEPNFLLFASGSIPPSADQRTSSSYGPLEGTPHNYIHPFVGGNMAGYMSPLDPVFWLHHNMVERVWVHWNLVRSHPNTDDRAWLDREFTEFCDENGDPVTISVALSLLFPILSYRYDDEGDGLPPNPDAADPSQEERDRGMWMLLNDESRAARDENTERAQRDAHIELEVLQRLGVTSDPLNLSSDEAATIQIELEPPMFELAAGEALRTLLVFDGVNLDFTTDFWVRVFINHPNPGPEVPPDDPHLVGAFASFTHDHGEGTTLGRFVLDAGPTLQRLGLVQGTLNINVVLVPFPDRPVRATDFEVRQIELQYARELIEVNDP